MIDHLSDQKLMEVFTLSQDHAAYKELVRRWEKRLFAYLVKASGNAAAAEDLRQEVFLRLYRYGDTYNGAHSFEVWLFKIASNALATWRRKEIRRTSHLERIDDISSVADTSASPGERVMLREISEGFQAAIRQFEPDERELILLRLDLELSYPEIAIVLGVAETTIKSRFYKLLARLRQSLAGMEIKPTRDEAGQREPNPNLLLDRRCES